MNNWEILCKLIKIETYNILGTMQKSKRTRKTRQIVMLKSVMTKLSTKLFVDISVCHGIKKVCQWQQCSSPKCSGKYIVFNYL